MRKDFTHVYGFFPCLCQQSPRRKVVLDRRRSDMATVSQLAVLSLLFWLYGLSLGQIVFASTKPYLLREVSLEFRDSVAPVGGWLLTDELDVEEGALARPVYVTGSLAPHDARGDIRHCVLWARNGQWLKSLEWRYMMTSSNGNIFRVTGHLCGKFTGPRWISRTKASDAELWCFLWFTPE